MSQFNYRLGFDLGYTSLGWACILLDDDGRPCGVHDFGVRIFPSGRDDKSKAPTSVARRDKRGARRNRDRYLMRRQTLLNFMIRIGLQPDSESKRKKLAEREPLALRAKGAVSQLTLHELGRALFHLNQRRGFKSNRIAERSGSEDESGLKKGIRQLENILKDSSLTLGQYLFQRLQRRQSTRLKAEESSEDRWTSRQMVENEFFTIINQQQQYYTDVLTDEVIDRLHEIIFSQRPLKAQKAGLCTLMDGEKRARLAYPQTQLFRILQEVNHLEIIKESANTPTMKQAMREKLITELSQNFSKVRKDGIYGILSWSAIEKIIGVKGVKFNLDNLGRKGLKADSTTRTMMAEVPDWWQALSVAQQRQTIEAIQIAQTDEDLASRFATFDFTTPDEVLEKLAQLHLDDGYGRVSLKAIEHIAPHLRTGLVYSDACAAAGINHSDDYDGQVFPEGNLPFYGEVLSNTSHWWQLRQ